MQGKQVFSIYSEKEGGIIGQFKVCSSGVTYLALEEKMGKDE
jgi:hypothetical protein